MQSCHETMQRTLSVMNLAPSSGGQSTLQGTTLNFTTIQESQTSQLTPPLTPVLAVHPATPTHATFTASISDRALMQAHVENTEISVIASRSDQTLVDEEPD